MFACVCKVSDRQGPPVPLLKYPTSISPFWDKGTPVGIIADGGGIVTFCCNMIAWCRGPRIETGQCPAPLDRTLGPGRRMSYHYLARPRIGHRLDDEDPLVDHGMLRRLDVKVAQDVALGGGGRNTVSIATDLPPPRARGAGATYMRAVMVAHGQEGPRAAQLVAKARR